MTICTRPHMKKRRMYTPGSVTVKNSRRKATPATMKTMVEMTCSTKKSTNSLSQYAHSFRPFWGRARQRRGAGGKARLRVQCTEQRPPRRALRWRTIFIMISTRSSLSLTRPSTNSGRRKETPAAPRRGAARGFQREQGNGTPRFPGCRDSTEGIENLADERGDGERDARGGVGREDAQALRDRGVGHAAVLLGCCPRDFVRGPCRHDGKRGNCMALHRGLVPRPYRSSGRGATGRAGGAGPRSGTARSRCRSRRRPRPTRSTGTPAVGSCPPAAGSRTYPARARSGSTLPTCAGAANGAGPGA